MNLLAILLLAASVNIPDDSAIRQLVDTRPLQAERTLLDALPQAQGTNTVALIKALGDLRSSAVVSECARHLDTAAGDLKDVCLYALSRTTSPRAAQLLRARMDDPATATAYLRHAESVAALGRTREPAVIALDLLRAKPVAVRCGALVLLTDVQGYAAQPTLLAMLDDTDRSVREQASRQLSRMPTPIGLTAAFQRAKGETRALLFAAIARRADANTTLLVQSLADADENIRRDAGLALRNKTGTPVDAEIAKLLVVPEAQAAALDLLAARRARSQAAAVMPLINTPVSKQAFVALGALAGEKEVEQLIAAAVASKDDAFRDQAVKAISAAAPRLADNSRCLVALANVPVLFRPTALSLLPAFGGKTALDTVVAATKYDDADSRGAAVRALAEWRDESAVEPLLALCRGTDEKVRVLAARGAVRVIEKAELDKEEKAALLKKVIEAAPRAEEKQQAQAALQGLDKKPEPPRRKKK